MTLVSFRRRDQNIFIYDLITTGISKVTRRLVILNKEGRSTLKHRELVGERSKRNRDVEDRRLMVSR